MKILNLVRVRKIINKVVAYSIFIIFFSLLLLPTALANPELITVEVSLGNSAGELKFFPSNLEFETGKQYKLVLDNPSPIKHYFMPTDK